MSDRGPIKFPDTSTRYLRLGSFCQTLVSIASEYIIMAEAIRAAYEDVRNDKTATNWLLCEFPEEKATEMQLVATGSGGISELAAAFKTDQVAYAYLRMNVSNDPLSSRAKFVFVSWSGPEVKMMRKARHGTYLSEIKRILSSFAIEKHISDRYDLTEEGLALDLKRAMGANYDRQASDY